MDSHERANYSAGKVLRTVFFLVFILVAFYFCKEILKHTDGTLVTATEDDPACQNIEAHEVLNQNGIGSIKCK